MREILQGILIGIGKIIPGVSGSLISISLGVYERAINSINDFFKDLKNNSKYLGKIGLGIIIAMSLISKFIIFLLNRYYSMTIMFFIGLILGSNKLRNNNRKYNYISLITFSIVLGLGLISKNNTLNFSNSFLQFLYLYFTGIIEAATMIIPGISGTAIMMMIGMYDKILNLYSSLFNFSLLFNNLSIILPLIFGIITGIYFISKVISYLFKVYRLQTYKAISGFLYGTIIYMLMLSLNNINSLFDLILGIFMVMIGFFGMKKINHFL